MNIATEPAEAVENAPSEQTEGGKSKQKKPYDYLIDELDNDGAEIVKIYAKFPEFVVYRTKNAIRIDINDDNPKKNKIKKRHLKISVRLGKIYSWLPEELNDSEPINKQIARAMTTNATGNHKEAQELLEHAEERILKTKTLAGRLHYTISAFIFTTIITLATLILAHAVKSDEIQTLLYVILCGSLGGLLSISLGFSSLEIDLDATRSTNAIIGCSRVIIAISAAAFSYFAIKSEIAFTFIAKSPEHYGFYLVAMMAGFIELLIPNMMNNLANNGKTTSEKLETEN